LEVEYGSRGKDKAKVWGGGMGGRGGGGADLVRSGIGEGR